DPISQDEFHELVAAKMRAAVRVTLVAIMNEEVEQFVGAPYGQVSATRRDYRNGHYRRDLVTTTGKIEDLAVPRTRSGFRTQVFEQYQRRQRELDVAIGEMFVKGISTAGVGGVLETLTGQKTSPSTVSRVYHGLEGEYAQWKTRPLAERYAYVFADGTYFSVIYGDEAHKTPILALIGITEAGKRELIAFTIGERENQGAWENLLDDIKARGVQTIDLWITDGHQAMLNAIALKFPDSQRQRCMRHKLDNVLAHIPDKQRDEVAAEFKAIFYQPNRAKADVQAAAFREKYRALYPTAIACMDRDWQACLTFYSFPEAHWARIRTTNVIERMFEEVKKRSKKMAAAFRNENSCLLLFYAVVRGLRFQNVVMPGQ
ncbi:MAG: IS256 family transposase, partial [Phycisphaerales bacterium]|nr:IS256 family transposase [Phycisphaerales bacterium]